MSLSEQLQVLIQSAPKDIVEITVEYRKNRDTGNVHTYIVGYQNATAMELSMGFGPREHQFGRFHSMDAEDVADALRKHFQLESEAD